jgi:hypothetical protein
MSLYKFDYMLSMHASILIWYQLQVHIVKLKLHEYKLNNYNHCSNLWIVILMLYVN